MHGQFTFIDLFAGIGGLRIPFDELGGTCILTSEKDKRAIETYQANFSHLNPESHRFDFDVTNLDAREVPRHDLLLAGFPCQPFSHAGHRLGFEDMRGTLFFDIMRILETLHLREAGASSAPRVILLENVRGLVTHDKGRTLGRIREELSRIYFLTEAVLNARDFGLPQSRQRLFIIGIRKDIPEGDLFSESFSTSLASREMSKEPTKVGTILENDVDEKYRISDRLWQSHKARKERHLERGNGWGFRLVTPESLHTATLSARYFKDGSEILIRDKSDSNPRKLTPTEGLALQGFPANFRLPVSDTQAFRQLGNAVPVSVVRFIAKEIKRYLVPASAGR
jgi:DNA (cytosine-5)-methyltransferase 1